MTLKELHCQNCGFYLIALKTFHDSCEVNVKQGGTLYI